MERQAFDALLEDNLERLQIFARSILAGQIEVAPFRRGQQTACDECPYASVCRFDRWSDPYRVLRSHRNETKRRNRPASVEPPG